MTFKYLIAFFMTSLLILPLPAAAMDQTDESGEKAEHSRFNVITEVINTLRFLQSTQDYGLAYGAVEQLDFAMDDIIAQGYGKLGEDYFKAQTLKSALEIIFLEKKLDLDGCYSARLGFQVDFALHTNDALELSPYDYPAMVKEAYFILDKLCQLY
ncbi:hypothetical protein TW85_16520 [Marinomonas sp. S3726]|uniref:hypothetical protein n=1 Tax=Marinomonas sp. S3726 TaxID=579484 RepID=UPI0005FA3238|nr:hypothetical protein [Marinomonas sp. S3726]KJZ11975.1 hypothetical protein TW85_16520 [Marinomonas sp. S3726]